MYDILFLPDSFPYGGKHPSDTRTAAGRADAFSGMENSCLTFATPSVIAGDRSAVDVCAHEISHVRLRFFALIGGSTLLIIHSRGSEMVSDVLRGVTSG